MKRVIVMRDLAEYSNIGHRHRMLTADELFT
jgi:hypothetical protein